MKQQTNLIMLLPKRVENKCNYFQISFNIVKQSEIFIDR